MEKVELPLLKGKDREKAIPVAVVVGLVILILVLVLSFLSLTIKKTYKLHYSENSNLDYNVYLKENDYYSEKYLTKDKQYIASLIDYISADFDYSFKSAENIGLEYTYYIVANLDVHTPDGKVLYEKNENLVNKKKFTELSNNLFKVSENVKIDYDKYNELAKEFINTYGLTAEATLDVSLYVDVIGKHAEFDKKISDEAAIKLSVPLTTKTVDVKMDYDLSNSVDETLQYREAFVSNPILLGICIFFAILDIAAIGGIIYWIVKNRDAETLYSIKLQKILKDYDRYVSETVITERVEDMIKTRSLRVEVVKSFEGLLDIRDNLGKPILYHEERPGEEAVFYILTERTGYIYVMRAADLKKEKKEKNTKK